MNLATIPEGKRIEKAVGESYERQRGGSVKVAFLYATGGTLSLRISLSIILSVNRTTIYT